MHRSRRISIKSASDSAPSSAGIGISRSAGCPSKVLPTAPKPKPRNTLPASVAPFVMRGSGVRIPPSAGLFPSITGVRGS